ncbi:hypothetical protein CPARK_000060400 [cyanobacterium endosymbiont of Braarudosphaera bigelowii]|uniref:Uncharacterized protein n=2 Tax=Candidatus Atelocyanobacterium thalassae TaxID=713887 RepID=A0A086CFD3_9CHRO|nr:MAG: hypothetical protein ucyna2_01291 [Candidatus Atelocyanobacterium thalassa isolate SIO64986]BDA39764.1 hypothetical protein CPARK_000060400 [cyanobacterium endosymbiont of Braarudosphaera bigelowii]
MESSSSSKKGTEPSAHRWTNIMGTVIAMITLTLPVFVIAYYSSNKADSPSSQLHYLNDSRK